MGETGSPPRQKKKKGPRLYFSRVVCREEVSAKEDQLLDVILTTHAEMDHDLLRGFCSTLIMINLSLVLLGGFGDDGGRHLCK